METRLSAGDVVPPGVSFAPRHVMCVPSAPHFGDDLQSEEDVHHVLKIHREGDAYKFQKFGNFTRIDSEYCLETTEELVGESLCHLTTAVPFWPFYQHKCRHGFIKTIQAFHDPDLCPQLRENCQPAIIIY